MAGIETLPRLPKPSDWQRSACGVPSDVRYTVEITHGNETVLIVRDLDALEWRNVYGELRRMFTIAEGFRFRTTAVTHE